MVRIVGDIGGTKTHLALVEGERWVKTQKYPSGHYKDLESIIDEFLGEDRPNIDKACFGIAGPVQDGKCQATNLPWTVDAHILSKHMHAQIVYMINDLEANAWGINVLSPKQFYVLNPGKPGAVGHRALISAGTGLGEAGMYFDGKTHHPFATEGGHADFSPRNALEIELLEYLIRQYGHVSSERVLSGPGLANIYRFLIESGKYQDNLGALEKDTLPKIVSDNGVEGTDPACVKALEIFCALYGAEAGNLALQLLALGGLYLGGGIAPKILPALKKGEFLSAFIEKGRFKELISSIPVYVILEENTALLGASHYLSKT